MSSGRNQRTRSSEKEKIGNGKQRSGSADWIDINARWIFGSAKLRTIFHR